MQEQIKYFSDLGLAKNSSTFCDRARALQTRLDKILENKIVIPKEIRKMFDINPGDCVVVLADKDRGIAVLKSDEIEDLTDRVLNK